MSSFALTQQLSDESRISKSFYCFCYNYDDGDNEIGSTSKFVRLGCQCIIHYECLIQYINHRLLDRTCGISNNGINCPYMKECKSFQTLDQDICESSFYNISFDDIENIITYGLSHDPELKKYLEECNLTIERINEIKLWLIPEPDPVPDPEYVLYILSTTKGCPNPNCGHRITHYHGHCSHDIGNYGRGHGRGGCPNCHVCFCFKCLSTEVENQQDRGHRSRCKCGYWSSFCYEITSLEDISKYISINDGGIPYDTRCGCVMCSDCRFNRPCQDCSGDCCVCRGYVNPSPNECIANLAHNTRGKQWKAVGPSLAADVNSNDDSRR